MTKNLKLKNIVFASIVIILVFTGIDYVGHKILEKNVSLEVVPLQYYYNKIFYGVFILFFAALIVNNLDGYLKVFVMTAIVVLALQYRYSGIYNARFNFIIMALHYIILAPLLYYADKCEYI